tara:strand:+ start:47 stop:571 length:525 start_codon:yes stop_codon:yes gene_type:complete
MENKKTNIKVKECTIFVTVANGEFAEYHKNNEHIKYNEEQTANLFELEPLHYGSELEGANLSETFNTYNWGAPFTFCGSYSGEVYDQTPSVVNMHLGGDARGNYSKPYICNDIEALFSQSAHVSFVLSNGEEFALDCENGEAYFDLMLDPYFIDFDQNITIEQYNELKEKCIYA